MKKVLLLVLVILGFENVFSQCPTNACPPDEPCTTPYCTYLIYDGVYCPEQSSGCDIKICITSWYKCIGVDGNGYSTAQCDFCDRSAPDNILESANGGGNICFDQSVIPNTNELCNCQVAFSVEITMLCNNCTVILTEANSKIFMDYLLGCYDKSSNSGQLGVLNGMWGVSMFTDDLGVLHFRMDCI